MQNFRIRNAGSIEHRTQHVWPPSVAHDEATRHHRHRRRPCRLIYSIRLHDKQRYWRGQRWPVQGPSVGMVLQGPHVPQILECVVLQVELLAASVRDGCTPRGYTDTYTGKTSRAGEGVESRDGLGDERTEAAQAWSGTEWYCIGQRVGRGGVEFSDEICYCLVREIVTFGDSGINSGRARSYSIFTMFLLGSCGSRRQIMRNITSVPSQRETHRTEINPLFRGLKSLPREYIKSWLVCHRSQPFFHKEKNTSVLVILSVPSIASRAASAIPPYSIRPIVLSPEFGAMVRRFYQERIWLQALKMMMMMKVLLRAGRDMAEGKRQLPASAGVYLGYSMHVSTLIPDPSWEIQRWLMLEQMDVSWRFYEILWDSMPTLLSGSRRFLMYSHSELFISCF